MSKLKEDIIEESAKQEEEEKKILKDELDEKRSEQDYLIEEGRRAERLKNSPDFQWLMDKIIARGQTISDIQNARLLNILKLTEGEKGTIDNIVAHSMQESVLGGEFLGLKNVKFWIDSAIHEKDEAMKILQQEKDEDSENEDKDNDEEK